MRFPSSPISLVRFAASLAVAAESSLCSMTLKRASSLPSLNERACYSGSGLPNNNDGEGFKIKARASGVMTGGKALLLV